MGSMAQTGLAEMCRPLWNNNELLCLLQSETRRVSMMKSEERKEGNQGKFSHQNIIWEKLLIEKSSRVSYI